MVLPKKIGGPPKISKKVLMKNTAMGLSLKKKMFEIATLCGVDGCMVYFNPKASQQIQIWPESKSDIQNIYGRYNGYGGAIGKKGKNEINLSSFRDLNTKRMHGAEKIDFSKLLAVFDQKWIELKVKSDKIENERLLMGKLEERKRDGDGDGQGDDDDIDYHLPDDKPNNMLIGYPVVYPYLDFPSATVPSTSQEEDFGMHLQAPVEAAGNGMSSYPQYSLDNNTPDAYSDGNPNNLNIYSGVDWDSSDFAMDYGVDYFCKDRGAELQTIDLEMDYGAELDCRDFAMGYGADLGQL